MMKKLKIILLIAMIGLWSFSLIAQKKEPYHFRYQTQVADEGHLKAITEVNYATTTSIRLYFEGTQLGENSYIVLEAMDGATQELRKSDLENWHYSSAYFNGQRVKISLFTEFGEINTLIINKLRVNDELLNAYSNQNIQSIEKAGKEKDYNPPMPIYGKAVGRFTNGTKAYGTGWIAPNGAIVTAFDIYYYYIYEKDYDIIEFNVPLSNNTTVNHPSPQDQYPVKIKSNNSLNNESVNFKNADYNFSPSGWAILEALPNSTGLRPGERQKEYFRIAANPTSSIVKSMGSIFINIIHYGDALNDMNNGKYKTLQMNKTGLLQQNDYLSLNTDRGRDRMIIYQNSGIINFFGSERGAPVMYEGSNVAIGIHSGFLPNYVSYGNGFRDSELRNDLNNFFTSQVKYVDSEGLYGNNANGQIDKPYLTIGKGVQNAIGGNTIFIAKGSYDEAVTINKALTLKAPVGEVIIGSSEKMYNQSRQAKIPYELLREDNLYNTENEGFIKQNSFKVFPNTFTEKAEIQFELNEKTPVEIKVFDQLGVEIKTLYQNSQADGLQSILWDGTDNQGHQAQAGMYLIKLQAGKQNSVIRVIKNQ